jgi:hypothetical protein
MQENIDFRESREKRGFDAERDTTQTNTIKSQSNRRNNTIYNKSHPSDHPKQQPWKTDIAKQQP